MPTNPTPKLSTHASRNPSKPTQQPRRHATDGTRSTQDLRAVATKEMKERMQDDVDNFHEYRIQKVTELANKYQKDESYFLKVLCNQSQYSTSRDMTLANAIRHDISVKAKERGESKKNAIELNEDLSEDEYQRIKASLTKEEEERLFAQLRAHRELKAKGIRATNRSAAADAVQNANRMGDVIRNLYERTGVCGLAMFTHGNPDDLNVPHFVDSDQAHLFFRQTFNMDMLDVLRKFKQWSCNSDAGLKHRTDLDFIRSEVGRLLTEGLSKIKNNRTLEMDYVNYRLRIVYELGVMLRVGGYASVIDDGTIHWVVMTKSQCDEVAREIDELRKQGPLNPHKEHADKGQKCGSYKKKAAKNADQENDEDNNNNNNEEDEEDDEDRTPVASKPAQVASHAAPSTSNVVQAVGSTTAPASNPPHVAAANTAPATVPASNPAHIAADAAVAAFHATAVASAATTAAPVDALPLDALFTPEEMALFSSDPANFDYTQLDLSGLDLSNVSPLIPDNSAPFPDVRLNTSNLDVSVGGSGHVLTLHIPNPAAMGSTATFGVFSANGNGGNGGSRKRPHAQDNGPVSPAKKARKERSDKGKKRSAPHDAAENVNTTSNAPAPRPRKRRSDAGVSRSRRT
ncbi:hypothetical protein C8R45DRAFT_1115593 [Mycena sanguinolenta]|nr:hypothetical protein C8R45DRAFT_1115593 [Mycena sanguinolenta]